jgi:3-phosphoshikimate 1-carboxyvinyltransferase
MLRAPADAAVVRPADRVSGRVRVPGDKSISHRYALLASLADGSSRIHGFSGGADCAATLGCLRALGVDVRRDGAVVAITGRGLGGLRAASAALDAANSGTTMRLLSGIVAAHPFRTIIGGDPSLSRRPMRRVIEPLTQMGAAIASDNGRPPLTIDGGPLRPLAWTPEVPSAQVKSCVLLAGLHAHGRTTVVEPVPTRDHTERALAAFGVTSDRSGSEVSVAGGQRLVACDLAVPGDVSGAAFWAVLAAAAGRGSITIEDVGLNPTRTAVLDVLRRAGAGIEVEESDSGDGFEPRGVITIRAGAGRTFAIEPGEVPALIDEIPALAALGARLPPGETMDVRGAAELRVKESDRISALAAGLRAIGAEIEEYEDGFRIQARPLTGGTADAAGDHRLAMAFAVAAVGARRPTTITGAGAVDVSYPGFFAELDRLTSA